MSSSLPPHLDQEIARHYQHGSLLQTILNAMQVAGKDINHLTADDLSAVDEFHTGGRQATEDLADQMGIVAETNLLDIGSGVGGPARFFAAHHSCRVTGIDLSSEYCQTATQLSSRTGLAHLTAYHHANAARIPFADETFDGAYMLHVGMNIPAKVEVFREIARVLKPGTVFGVFDIMRESQGDLTFPLPWASSAETSFVETPAAYLMNLADSGFEITKQRNRRDFALAFLVKMREAAAIAASSKTSPPLGVPIIMGPSAPLKLSNLTSMIQQGLLSPTEIVCRKH